MDRIDMDRDSPESLLQFMNDASSSVRAALERPLEGKNINQETFLQKCLLPNQGASKERRRFKTNGGRRRRSRRPSPQNSSSDFWSISRVPQPHVLKELLGIQDPHAAGAYQDPRLTEWEAGLQWSPNLNRECSDESVSSCGTTTDWQGLLNNSDCQSTSQGKYYNSEAQAYGAEYGLGKGMYSQMSRTQFTYKQRSAPRTLDEVINMMPVGCHLPPPIPSCTTFQGIRQQDGMDAVSQKMMPLILGFSKPEDQSPNAKHAKIPEPPTVSATVPLISNQANAQANAEYTSADLDLLSELVSDLDKTNTLDKLTTDSAFQQSSKEITIEDLRALSKDCTADVFSRDQNAFSATSAQTYEGQPNNYRDWNKYNFDIAQSGRRKLTVKSQSFELSTALEDTHLGGSEPLHYPTNGTIANVQQQRKTDVWRGNNSMRIKSQMLMSMHESRSMPNLRENAPVGQDVQQTDTAAWNQTQINPPPITGSHSLPWKTVFNPPSAPRTAVPVIRPTDVRWTTPRQTNPGSLEASITRCSNPTWSTPNHIQPKAPTSQNSGDLWSEQLHGPNNNIINNNNNNNTATPNPQPYQTADEDNPTSSSSVPANVQNTFSYAKKDQQSVNISWTNGNDGVATIPRTVTSNPTVTPTRQLHHRLQNTQWKSWHSGMNPNAPSNVQPKITVNTKRCSLSTPPEKWSDSAEGHGDAEEDQGHQQSNSPSQSCAASNTFRLPSFAYTFLNK